MSKKISFLTCTIISIIAIALLSLDFYTNKNYERATSKYQVYLDGNKIGLISSKNELYDLINQKQSEIKKEYNVNQVYPPKGFQIIRQNTYEQNETTVEDIYDIIQEDKAFTLKGYTITITREDEDKEPIYIYVLDQNVFKEALENVVKTFIGEERYQQYVDKTQPEIVDTGYIIESMYFQENIKIKESYISSEEKIYTDANELTKHLLFNDSQSTKEYTVVQGDTIASVAEANELNINELLLVNDDIDSEDTLLAVGQKINVALIEPMLNLVYENLEVSDTKKYYQTEYIDDPNEYIGYKKVQTAGEDGISRVTLRVQYINGNQSTDVGFSVAPDQIIKPVVNEVIIRGTKKPTVPGSQVIIISDNSNWGWPTDSTYYTSSSFGWRTLNGIREYHDGLDIPRPAGSPIYAALDGVVINAGWGGYAGSSAGYNVVIQHANGYSTVYAHCSKIYVKNGQTVSKGQLIAGVGQTGRAFGNHLHFGVFVGVPYSNGRGINPLQFYK